MSQRNRDFHPQPINQHYHLICQTKCGAEIRLQVDGLDHGDQALPLTSQRFVSSPNQLISGQ